jgi:hypothetical protein
MAVITQADPYKRLARKIGYSVGLEDLVGRVSRLVELYSADGQITLGTFTNLIENGFGRRNAVHHFANLYAELKLLRMIGRSVEPLFQLDTLAILHRLIGEDRPRFQTAVQTVLTQCLVEEDGDIFLNGLVSSFRPVEMRACLVAMVSDKIQRATRDMHSPAILKKISEALSIKNQTELEKRAPKDSDQRTRFARRTSSLDAQRRTAPLSPSFEFESPTIPDDYLDKVSKTRRSWAHDLGFFMDGARTSRGDALLERLTGPIVSKVPNHPALAFWGYGPELEHIRLRLQLRLEGIPEPVSWDLLGAINAAFLSAGPGATPVPNDEEVVRLLQVFFEQYGKLNITKSLIRNSLPLYVAEPALAGFLTSAGQPTPDLPGILQREYIRQDQKRIQKMIIRGTAGALFFMR